MQHVSWLQVVISKQNVGDSYIPSHDLSPDPPCSISGFAFGSDFAFSSWASSSIQASHMRFAISICSKQIWTNWLMKVSSCLLHWSDSSEPIKSHVYKAQADQQRSTNIQHGCPQCRTESCCSSWVYTWDEDRKKIFGGWQAKDQN